MTAIILTLTDAGLAALTNPAHTGTAALTISHIGLSQQHAGAPAAQQVLTGLPGEFKRLETFGGEVLSPRTIHVFLRDESADAYSLRAFGLYASTGVLMAVVSSETPIMEKVPATTLLQAVDLTFARDIDAELVFGDTNFVNPPATMTRTGVVRLATAAEAESGERQDLAVTPWSLAKTLLSWSQNFAARLHGHSILDVNGLSDALAGKAAKNHQHSAADTTTGTFDPERIPNIPQSKVQNLTQTLAGKAAKAHEHDAAETTAGIFHIDRIPKLSIGWISNLTETLADKAQALHSHTMAQVSGLVGALALKANLESPDITGYPRLPAVTLFKKEFPDSQEGGQFRLERPDTGTRLAGHVAIDVNGDNVRIYEEAEPYRGFTIPIADMAPGVGSYPWTSTNFNPASKANVDQPSFTSQIHLTSSSAQFRAIGDGDSLFLQAGSNTSAYGNMILSGLFGHNLTSLRVQFNGALHDIFHRGNFNPATKADLNGWTDPAADGLATGYKQFIGRGIGSIASGNGAGNQAAMEVRGAGGAAFMAFHRPGQFATFFGIDDDNQLKIGGWSLGEQSFRVWTELNFNPTSKVDVFNPDGYPHEISLGWNGERMVARVDNAAAASGQALVHLNDAASAADAVGGSATNRFITPAALWSFARSIGRTGHQQIPGTDLIVQWGFSTASIPEGTVHTTLPTAFGGGCLFACAIPRNPTESHSMDYYMQVVSRHLDRIVFYANRANNSAGNMSGYEWLALGLAKGSPDPAYSSGGGYPPGGGGWEGGGPEIIP